ncbi:MAG: M12 family metallo-peptidase [Phycisphaerales bacterium]
MIIRPRKSVRAFVCMLAATLGLLIPVQFAGATNPPLIHSAEWFDSSQLPSTSVSIRSRAVQIDLGLLDTTLRGDDDTVQLQLFEHTDIQLRLDRVTYVNRAMTSWVGRLGDGTDAADWYTLVRNQDVLVANFWMSDGRAFEIRPLDDTGTVHVVHEIQPSLFGPCETCSGQHGDKLHGPLDGAPFDRGVEQSNRGCEDDGSVIDVLVVYTPSARSAAGGTSAIQALAFASIDSTNQAYINSNIQTSVRLAHLAEVNYSESGSFGTDLNNLRTGVVPGVLEMREVHNADMVAMLNNGSGSCGIGYLMQTLSPGFESLAFSVTRYSCAVGNLTFAHELGHNMGCQHDAANAGSNPLFPYSFGWRWTANSGQLRRSVMAYAPGSRVPHFSNPEVLNGGAPTGDAQQAFNALTINNTAYTIANFRVGDCGPQECEWSALDSGVNGTTLAIAPFNDGSGSAMYAAGDFLAAGGADINRIARWDGTSWSALGSGINGTVHALKAFNDGSGNALYAGGFFSNAGGVSTNSIARWNGTDWSSVGSGLDDLVQALAVFDDGSGPALYAGGRFTMADGQATDAIARWDGQQWSPLGSGLGSEVLALVAFEDDQGPALFAAGNFLATIGIRTARGIAKWDGSEWTTMGLGLDGSGAHALGVADQQFGRSLFVGGGFLIAGSEQASGIARWACRSVLCPADVTGDGEVSLGDLNLVLANFGQQTSEGDTNGDGVVDLADLNAVLAAFGTSCP